MRRFDKLKNIEKANMLAEQRYLETKGFVNESENKVITEETYDDLFHFLNTDPKKMTQGSVYYVSDMNSSMNKNIIDDKGDKVPNPLYGKLFKHTRFMFKWEDTFTNAMERIDPNYVPGQRSGHYEKIDGYKVLEKGPNGLYLPILPTGSEYKIFVDNNGELEEMDKEAAKKFLRPASPTKTETPTKAAFRLLMLDKIAKVTGGGNDWVNPNFKGEYKGFGTVTENEELNEISSDTFKSAINVSKERGTDRRTYKLGELYLNQFMGKDLIGGKITNIGVNNPQQGNYSNVSIEVTKSVHQDSGYNKGKTQLIKDYIYYDINKDLYEVNEIDRKDAVVLSKIAQLINPNTKYKETGKYFKIKGW